MPFFNNSTFLNRIASLSGKLGQEFNINLLAKFIQDNRDIQLLGTTESLIVDRFNSIEFVSASKLNNDLHQDFFNNNQITHGTNNMVLKSFYRYRMREALAAAVPIPAK